MEQEKLVVNLKRQLQTSFRSLDDILKIWSGSSERCCPVLSIVSNRVEQYQCCAEAKLDDDPVANAFSDLRDRLLCQIAGEMEEPIQALRKEMERLHETCSKISKLNIQTMKQYNRSTSVISLDAIETGSATCPAVAEMLEWLSDIERILLQQYHCKMHLLDSFRFTDPQASGMMLKHWHDGDSKLFDMIQDYLCHVSFLMEEKL